MKTIRITVALLLTVASLNAWAQTGGGNLPDRRPTPTAEGVSGSKSGSPSNTSGQNSKSSKGSYSTRSESGTAPMGGQSSGTSPRQRSKPQTVNKQAAGVPKTSGTASSSASKANRNQ